MSYNSILFNSAGAYRFVILILLLVFISNPVVSQKVLTLDIIGIKLKRIRYNEGDRIAIKIKNEKVIYKGELYAISDSSFFINGNYIALDSVSAVVKYSKAAKGISVSAFSVAALTGVISGLDIALKGGEINQGNYFVPAVFTGIGLALLPFWKRTYRLGENKILKVIDLSPI